MYEGIMAEQRKDAISIFINSQFKPINKVMNKENLSERVI